MDQFYSITDLSKDLGITPRTIRFYEAKGLVSPKRAGNTRVYTHRDRARMILILRGKQLGFTLSDIKEFLDLYEVDRTQAVQIRLLATRVRQRIDQLEDQRRALELSLAELYAIEREANEALKHKEAETGAA